MRRPNHGGEDGHCSIENELVCARLTESGIMSVVLVLRPPLDECAAGALVIGETSHREKLPIENHFWGNRQHLRTHRHGGGGGADG